MIHPGSFRDPDARVFITDGRILRGLSEHAAAIDAEVRGNGLMAGLVGRGLFVENERVEGVPVPGGVPDHAVVEARPVPIVSHPGEWSFAMLRDAALITLDANLAALDHGFILKDASGYNVLFDGSSPVIVDVSSLDRFEGLWNAYAQFCDHFLAPLMLEAYSGVPFQQALRTSTIGLPIVQLDGMLGGRSRWRKGVPTHVRMRARTERSAGAASTADRRRYRDVRLPATAVANTMRSMRSLVAGMTTTASSTWSGYEQDLPYGDAAADAKHRFVEKAASNAADHSLALDVGGNAGRYSRILGDHFEHVVAVDVDPGAVDALYRTGIPRLTPLVVDVTNPTPAFGWRSVERSAFFDRVRPSFTSWLAVVHHLCLGQGVPLDAVVDLVADSGGEAVVEFVHEDDPMVARITASRRGHHPRYDRATFEALLRSRGTLLAEEQVAPTRTLYHVST